MANVGMQTADRDLGKDVARRTSSGGLMVRRWAGAWIDYMALGLLFFMPGFVVSRFTATPQVPVIVGLILVWLYFPLLEGLSGRTVGKLITGTVVVNEAGGPPGFRKAVVRTLLRFAEVNPILLGGIPAGLVAGFSESNQRLGDMIAQTYVVPLKELRAARLEERRIADQFD